MTRRTFATVRARDISITRGNVVRMETHGFAALAGMVAEAPDEVAFQARNMVGRFFGGHRRRLLNNLRSEPGNLQRLVSYSRKVGEERRRGGSVLYKVNPPGSSQDTIREKTVGLRLADIYGTVYTRSPVAIIHEEGGTIRGRGGRRMTVPVGRFGKMTRKRRRQVLGPRSGGRYPGLFPSKNGRALLRRRGKTARSKPEVVFALLHRVHIKPRLGIMRAWDEDGPGRQRRLNDAIENTRKHIGRKYDRLYRAGARTTKGALGGFGGVLRRVG